jgi:ribosomal protein L32
MAMCLPYPPFQTDRTELTYVNAKGSNCPNCGANSHKNNKCVYCGTESGIITFEKTKLSNEEMKAIEIKLRKLYGTT